MTGLVYRIKFRAINEIGIGEFSDVTEVAMVSLPTAPDAPVKVLALSTETSITVKWESPVVSSAEMPGGRITNYQLFMDDGEFGDFALIQETKSSFKQFTMSNLLKGAAYRFKVVAFNLNGQGEMSLPIIHYSCSTPFGLSPPEQVSTSPSGMVLSWSEPSDNGGCPITGFQLYRDDGISGDASIEVTSSDERI